MAVASQYQLVEVGRPDIAALLEAIGVFESTSSDKSGESLMAAGLVIIGEACVQLETEKKTKDEVITSLVRQGLSQGVATVWVDKAADVVSDTINKDPERFIREHSRGIGKGEIAFYVVTVLLAIFMLMR